SRLELRSAIDVRPGSLTGDFDLFLANLDTAAGTVRLGLGRGAGPIADRGSGSVALLTFHIRADAPPGPAVINLLHNLDRVSTLLNEGGLVLNPEPSNEAGDPLDGLITVSENRPATVASVVVNDGAAARVTSMTVTFSSVVRFLGNPADAFRLLGPRGDVQLVAAVSTAEDNGQTFVRLTFPDARNGSLAEGKYTLRIDGDQIVDAAGQAVDANGDGMPGGVALDAFFRLFDDTDGAGPMGHKKIIQQFGEV